MTTRTKLFMAMIVAIASIATTYSVAIAQSGGDFPVQSLAPTASCLVPKVDGERVPFPLQKANTKFDLSEGETYLLNGNLVLVNSKVYLKVDFTSQPWLETASMSKFPYLQVNVDPALVARYAGRMIQIAVIAHSNHSQLEEEKMVLFTVLTPVTL